MAVLGLCPNQGAAVAVQALTTGGNGRELWPFWNVVLMAVCDETTAFISWLWWCCEQENVLCKQKYLSLI
jgi:hypothetical protein